jgi:hypothetical protein
MNRLVPSHSTPLPAPEAALPGTGTAFLPEVLRLEMRRLWADRVALVTRFHTAMIGGGSDTARIADQLLRNHDAIGNAWKAAHGEEAGDRLSSLLRDQFLLGAGLLRAARAGGAAAFERARRRWQANADELTSFLASGNSHGSGETLEGLHADLAMTTDAVVANLHRRAVDAGADHALPREPGPRIVDALASGIGERLLARVGP